MVSLLTGWGFMASPALRMWAESPDISHQLHLQTVTDPHWSPLCPVARWLDEEQKKAQWFDPEPLVQK